MEVMGNSLLDYRNGWPRAVLPDHLERRCAKKYIRIQQLTYLVQVIDKNDCIISTLHAVIEGIECTETQLNSCSTLWWCVRNLG